MYFCPFVKAKSNSETLTKHYNYSYKLISEKWVQETNLFKYQNEM